MKDEKRRSVKLENFAAGISRKLALLLGGTLAVSSAVPSAGSEVKIPERQDLNRAEAIGNTARPLPPKLILKQTGSTFKMIAQHDSHSSHSSHASHASHSSHTSSAA
jgi:hypothetical protein